MSEIITIQAGHFSNFIGTHWWNLQESCFRYDENSDEFQTIKPGITFREGITRNRDLTFTPRLVSIDLKGSLKSLEEDGTLYNDLKKEHKVLWDGNTDVHSEDVETKNQFLKDLELYDTCKTKLDEDKDICQNSSFEFKSETSYNLDNSVQVWSDFLKVHLHPKSVYVVKDHNLNSGDDTFSVFGNGKDLFNTEVHRDQIEDRIRYFAEECDFMQGFHVLMDAQNGFAGLGSAITEYLNEEYSKKTILAIPSLTPNISDVSENHVLNSLLCYDSLINSSSIFSPISLYQEINRRFNNPVTFHDISYKSSLLYHSSSILAVALDAITSSYRCGSSTASLNDFNEMVVNGKKATALSLELPFSLSKAKKSLTESTVESSIRSLTPNVSDLNSELQWVTVRGMFTENATKQGKCAVHSSDVLQKAENSVTQYIQKISPKSYCRVSLVEDQMNVTAPFPDILNSLSGTHVSGKKNVDVLAGLHTSKDLKNYFKQLSSDAVRSYSNLNGQFSEFGLEREDYIDALHNIKNLSDNYA